MVVVVVVVVGEGDVRADESFELASRRVAVAVGGRPLRPYSRIEERVCGCAGSTMAAQMRGNMKEVSKVE